MADWTMSRVQDRLELAADVFAQMPTVKPQGYFNAWPEYFHSFADQVGQEPRMRRPRPSPRQITQAEEAMLWLRWLEKDDARLVWLRANLLQNQSHGLLPNTYEWRGNMGMVGGREEAWRQRLAASASCRAQGKHPFTRDAQLSNGGGV